MHTDYAVAVIYPTAADASYYKVSKIVGGKTYTGYQVKKNSYKLAAVLSVDYIVYVTAYGSNGEMVRSDAVTVTVKKKLGKINKPRKRS